MMDSQKHFELLNNLLTFWCKSSCKIKGSFFFPYLSIKNCFKATVNNDYISVAKILKKAVQKRDFAIKIFLTSFKNI